MRLSKIDIWGFKSFRDRVTVDLSEGMNAIVGPNGCGKSNVVDAIKWAMGDMSPKSLRGSSMSDLIFAGSAQHKPMGMAEVTLTFDNEDGLEDETEWSDSIPREFRELSEIAVTRRLHRSGESEYLINKTPCRLMDIQNLLAGTGVGKQGYSIIEQNQVGFIVGAKPSERRLVIEEASGITRYQSQRKRTERRLQKAEENLQRVADILAEVQKRIRSLERQAKRASQHRRFVDELRALNLGLLLRKRRTLLERVETLKAKLEERAEKRTALQAHVNSKRESLESLKVESFAAERAHAAATEAYYKVETRLNIARNARDSARRSIEDVERRSATAHEEAVQQAERKADFERELESVRSTLVELPDFEDESRALAESEKSLSELTERLSARERKLVQARQTREERQASLQRSRDRLQWIVSQREELSTRHDEVKKAVSELEAEIEAAKKRHEAAGEAQQAAEAKLEAVAERQETLDAEFAVSREKLVEAQQRARELRTERVDLSTQLESLEEMVRQGAGFDDAVQAVLEWAQAEGRDDLLGPLANLIHVPEELDRMVSLALRARLSDVVVRNRQTALDAIAAIEPDTPVAFWVAPNFDPDAFLEDVQQTIRTCASTDEIPAGFDGDAFATDARIFIGGDGRVVSGVAADGSGAIMKRQRRIAELRQAHTQLTERCGQADEALEEARSSHQENADKVEVNRQALESARFACKAAVEQVERESRELARAIQSLERTRAQMVPILRKQESIEAEGEELAERVEDLEAQVQAARVEVTGLEESTEELRTRVQEMRDAVGERKVRLAEVRERRSRLEESRQRLSKSVESSAKLIERYRTEAEHLGKQLQELQDELKDASERFAASEEGIEKARADTETAKTRVEKAAQNLAEIEVKVQSKVDKLSEVAAEVQEIDIDLRETRVGIEHLDEQFGQNFEVSISEARGVASTLEIPDDQWESRRDYLKRRLDSMGAVNAMAESEYEEASEREVFLVEQSEDLERSASDLRKAIAAMDRESRRRFKETFDAVSEKFEEIFPKLFRGGYGKLILTDPDDVLNTGVDIEVCPPGKRLQNVSLLSGGEKALTAVSLIFSIFSLKPTPFSILDEVDAPLDEANVGRFAEMVLDLSKTSQMIVITHSRRTMEAADLLYGVTMEDPGVSKIVSVRLSEIDDRLAS